MTPDSAPSDEQLARYLCDDCTSEESLAVQAWLAGSPAHARRLEQLRWLVTPASAQRWHVDTLWSRVRAETIDTPMHPLTQASSRRRAPRVALSPRVWRSRIAAALLIGVVGAAGWYASSRRVPIVARVAPDVVYRTSRGQVASVQLSDGSHVRLAPQSKLTIAGTYGDSLRELTLVGEADFDVRHDAARPFQVRTRTTVTEDIGTRFDLRAYADEAKVAVAVAEGAVTLSVRVAESGHRSRPQGVLLRAGELGVLDAAGAVSTTGGAAAARALAWTKGEFVFVKQPLPEVLRAISRWFDLDIHVADAVVAAHPVTAEFSTQSADEMLQALAVAVEAVVERNGRHVTLKARQ